MKSLKAKPRKTASWKRAVFSQEKYGFPRFKSERGLKKKPAKANPSSSLSPRRGIISSNKIIHRRNISC
jgi:hypothetical protein